MRNGDVSPDPDFGLYANAEILEFKWNFGMERKNCDAAL
jgi:hypothetical protein